MGSIGIPERPPSPPHSNDGDIGLGDDKSQTAPQEPYTPPRSLLPAPKLNTALDPYGDPSIYQTAPTNNFYPIQPTFVRTSQLRTPPAATEQNGIHTRSGRALGSPLSPTLGNSSRPSGSPRMKSKPKPSKGKRKNGAPLIDEPLSTLTKDYKIPVKDMHTWVHRPVSERLQQAVKNKNHISRPMNSFMLYRSAYADRVKQYCKENNHQVVSQVTGASWPLEPQEVREMYEEYARIERDNHQNAHPDYKFAPNKNGKKRGRSDDDEYDEDPEWEGSKRGKRSRTGTSGPSRSQSSTPFEDRKAYHPHMQSYLPALHPSSYWASNPHGQPVMGLPEEYYQAVFNSYGQPVVQRIDEAAIRRTDNPFPLYDQSGSLVSLPNGNHQSLLGQYGRIPLPPQLQGDVLDPQLSQPDHRYQYEHYETIDPGYAAPRTSQYEAYPTGGQQVEYDHAPSYHPGMATLTDGHNPWGEPGEPGSDFDQEFQRWD